jgi:curli biogenesis system outer membrane secretion channel CsgG
MRKITTAVAALALATSFAAATPAAAQFGMDKKQPKNAATPELPRCAQPLGRVAIMEPENRWWTELGLSNPEVLIKLFAARSGCLRVVDRNGGLTMRGVERDLAGSGELQRNSNIGRGQVAAADYFIVPDIANSDSNTGGNAIGAVAGSLLPGGFGALAGSLRTQRAQAQALITLVDARTTEQVYVAEGVAQKTNIGFGGGAGGFGTTGFLGAAGGGYSDTDIGKVISAAYFNAFVDLVGYLQANSGQVANASANAPIQAYSVKSAIVMRASAAPTAKAVRNFAAGDLVYPTGQKNGIWWEVDDENGNRGWVTSVQISPR